MDGVWEKVLALAKQHADMSEADVKEMETRKYREREAARRARVAQAVAAAGADFMDFVNDAIARGQFTSSKTGETYAIRISLEEFRPILDQKYGVHDELDRDRCIAGLIPRTSAVLDGSRAYRCTSGRNFSWSNLVLEVEPSDLGKRDAA